MRPFLTVLEDALQGTRRHGRRTTRNSTPLSLHLEYYQYLLPSQDHLHLNQWKLDHATHQLTLVVSSTQRATACPLCQTSTQKIHSRYERQLQDLPCVQFGVTLRLQRL
ncbi:transposase family protein [Trichocoleus sp. DQ-A3]|uniref:transposase family protein n=1 Tax=Cyanophyceae TaxID=3028117 RepID=UPI001688DE48|nr:transposase family protein [Coleofasciculus sp. FACHB-125]MBD1902555.1 transposase family protein [Coleofasciculus sp. FACHB-125]